jgi:purine nucleosidase
LKFPLISTEKLLNRLQHPKKKLRMVLDTDTFNEIDDQFALTYALMSPEQLQVEAVYAAPFYNHLSSSPEDGMERSYEEILRVLARLNISSEGYVYRGSTDYLKDLTQPIRSDAALDLIQKAMASNDNDPLYVVAIGAITNVASAILIEPRIIEKIVVVWLGGHALHWPDTNEFNLQQDVLSARIIFDCGVPLILIPCEGVASHLLTTLSEMRDFVKGKGLIGDFLYQTFENCHDDHFAYSRVIWDIATIAYLVNPDWVPTHIVASPVLTDQVTWSINPSRHFIRYAYAIHRDPIFRDMFNKLNT